MPRRPLVPLACLAALAFACQPTGFRTELKGEATVPGGAAGALNAFPVVTAFSGLDFDANPDFKNQGVAKSQVGAAKAEAVKVRVLSPADQDFSFLDSLQVVARSGDVETLFAEKNAIADLGLAAPNPTLSLDVKPVALRDHLAAPSTSFIVRAKGRVPSKDTRVEVTLTLRVDLSGY
jgi:hypothetical protein